MLSKVRTWPEDHEQSPGLFWAVHVLEVSPSLQLSRQPGTEGTHGQAVWASLSLTFTCQLQVGALFSPGAQASGAEEGPGTDSLHGASHRPMGIWTLRTSQAEQFLKVAVIFNHSFNLGLGIT